MNFKIEDTAWASGVGASILSFLIGLFTAFSLAGSNVFIINLLLLLVAIGAILSGIALLLAATEVYMKLHRDPETKLSRIARRLYRSAMGEELDVAKAYQILEAAQAYPQTQAMPKVEIIDDTNENNEVPAYDAYAPMTPEQIIATSLMIDTIIQNHKENIRVPLQPVNKPTVHSIVDTQPVETIDKTEEIKGSATIQDNIPAPEDKEIQVQADINGIITIGPDGISSKGDEFKSLLEECLEKSINDESYRLKLSGKTYGIGARGTKVSEGENNFISFNRKEIEKIYKKLIS